MATKPIILRIGVDTGGTFTDLILDTGDGKLGVTHKLLSTPDDPGRAVLEGISALLTKYESASGGSTGASSPLVIHGSTVATNALLEGKGADAAFITTKGFEDTLFIGRQNRPRLYDLEPVKPHPPVRREACIGIDERVAYNGEVLVPFDEAGLAGLSGMLSQLGVQSIAVSLLHSYANPAHERLIAEHLRERLPGLHLTVSHELLPEFREYERAATCIVNAVVAPPMGDYINRLSDRLGANRLRVMASAGGTLPPQGITQSPVHTILSGPAGGVVGALAAARAGGITRIITVDMGGTSTDVSLCDGALTMTTESEIAGLPIRLPMIDIHTVGAGGGSIAWLDDGGALRVGPESMGADPGPACYGRQPQPYIPTVTDAHVVLGNLPADRPLGGDLKVNLEAAREAVGNLANAAGLELEQTARGILRVAEATMARAIQCISVERGHDPRDFTLVPFGGAGGLHAVRLAEHLGMRRVLVPVDAGLLSALGMLASAPLHAFSQAVMHRLIPDGTSYGDVNALPQVTESLGLLRRKADDAMDTEGIDPVKRMYQAALDLRYTGQSYELTIPLSVADPVDEFTTRHNELYGYCEPGRPIEIVAARLTATCEPEPICFGELPRRTGSALDQRRYYARDELLRDDRIEGPAVVSEYSATTLIPAGWSLAVNAVGQLVLEQNQGEEN